jgi:hypothetical protein
MRTLYVVGFVTATVFILTTSTWPIAAMVIYPWCVNYGGGREGGAQNCGFTSRQQCELTRAGNGGFCVQNPWYEPYHLFAAYPAMITSKLPARPSAPRIFPLTNVIA